MKKIKIAGVCLGMALAAPFLTPLQAQERIYIDEQNSAEIPEWPVFDNKHEGTDAMRIFNMLDEVRMTDKFVEKNLISNIRTIDELEKGVSSFYTRYLNPGNANVSVYGQMLIVQKYLVNYLYETAATTINLSYAASIDAGFSDLETQWLMRELLKTKNANQDKTSELNIFLFKDFVPYMNSVRSFVLDRVELEYCGGSFSLYAWGTPYCEVTNAFNNLLESLLKHGYPQHSYTYDDVLTDLEHDVRAKGVGQFDPPFEKDDIFYGSYETLYERMKRYAGLFSGYSDHFIRALKRTFVSRDFSDNTLERYLTDLYVALKEPMTLPLE